MSPKRGAGAGVGVGMVRRTPVIEGDSLGFLVLGFLVWSSFISWSRNSKVSMLQSSKVSRLHRYKNFDPILLNVHFMLSGRYWSHLQDFQEFNYTDRQVLSAWSFQKFSKCPMSEGLRFPKIICSDHGFVFYLMFKSILVSPKINNIGFGAHGQIPKARNHEN